MTPNAAPHVDCEQHHPTLAVSDVLAAADFYTKKLGFSLGFTWGTGPVFGVDDQYEEAPRSGRAAPRTQAAESTTEKTG